MDAEKVTQLFWTPGDSALGAWKIMGQGVGAMDGLLLTDATGEITMTVLGYRKYAAKRREQREEQARSRAERSRPPPEARDKSVGTAARPIQRRQGERKREGERSVISV